MPSNAFDVPRYLSLLPLFKDMSEAKLERITAGSRLRRLGRGDAVFRAGDPCAEFNIAVTGQVKVYAISPAGQEKVIELAGPGISFAEAPTFTGDVHGLNAQALTDTLLLSIARQALIDEIALDASLALRMLTGLSHRLQGVMHDVETNALHSGLQRVINYLLRDHPDAGGSAATVSLPASKATIASRLSLTPEYFSRVLHELQSAGLLRIDKRAIRIPDLQRLGAYQAA